MRKHKGANTQAATQILTDSNPQSLHMKVPFDIRMEDLVLPTHADEAPQNAHAPSTTEANIQTTATIPPT